MESFVFNSFKKRLLEGKVNLEDNWKHYPVNKNFVTSYGDDARSMENSASFIMYDLANNPDTASAYYNVFSSEQSYFNAWYNYYGTKFNTYEYRYKSMAEQDIPAKPEFVTLAGWENFSDKENNSHLKGLFFSTGGTFYKSTGLKDTNGIDIPRGFYYVRIKEELLWCANKVNDSTTYDNEINIVLGDNIGTAKGDISKLRFCIGSNPAQPFNGIFYGNGYGFINCELHCKSDVGGVIGYLSKQSFNRSYAGAYTKPGIISHVWVKNCSIVNDKEISLSHLSTGGFDVAAGFLCGKNDGIIEHVYVSDKIGISGFIPKMYSCSNKMDNIRPAASGEAEASVFYPDYLCYNSLGNIVPYIGYFNEGVFATYSGYSKYDNQMHTYWNTIDNYGCYPIKKSINRSVVSPQSWSFTVYADYKQDDGIKGRIFHFTAPANRKTVLWYDTFMIEDTMKTHTGAKSIGTGEGESEKMHGILLLRDNDWFQAFRDIEYTPYFDKSIKMNQQNRAAYYVSPIVGINTGTLNNIYLDTEMEFSGTFVGFAGGLAGKMSDGYVSDCYMNLTASDVFESNGYPTRNTYKTYDAASPVNNYSFIQKSIKNIGGLFGSLVVGDSITISNVSSYFNNQMQVIRTDNNDYMDYYFDNRFGGIAAIVEYNSCNISDLWYYNSEIAKKFHNIRDYIPDYDYYDEKYDVNSTDGNRSIFIRSCNFNYAETYRNNATTTAAPIGYIQNDYWEYGVSSPLFAEIKPTYLSVPSIISTPFYNTSKDIPQGGISTTEHIGLFTMDQQLASPPSNPNFWGINLEVDLPGVSNGFHLLDYDEKRGWKYDGYAGGVIDALNAQKGVNFSLDIKQIASRFAKWLDVEVKSNVYNGYDSYMSTVTVPVAARIDASYFEEITESINDQGDIVEEFVSGPYANEGINFNPPDTSSLPWRSYRAQVYSYNGNKKLLQYPYWGSDLYVIPTTLEGNGNRDTLDMTSDFYDYVEIESTDIPYCNTRGGTTSVPRGYLDVGGIKIQIRRGAFDYAPFGEKEFETADQIDTFYKVYVKAREGHNAHRIDETWNNETHMWKMSENTIPPIPSGSRTKGTTMGGISYLPDFFYESYKDSVKNWLDANANGARWGWYFYDDYDDTFDSVFFYNFFLAFDVQKYDRTTESGCFPPNWPFIVGYLCGQEEGDYKGTQKKFINSDYDRPAKKIWPNEKCTIKFYRDGNDTPVKITDDIYELIRPKTDFTEMNNVGRFRNSLYLSESTMPTGLTQDSSTPVRMQQTVNKDAWYSDMKYLAENVKKARVETAEEVSTYFKYTYSRTNLDINKTEIWPASAWAVKYDYYNNRAGFWIENKNAQYIDDYRNDKFRYSQNYVTMGQTLNEQCILHLLEKPAIQKAGLPLTAFSADDFEGIYVTDSENNPVMYIDVGMGECSPGTTWSYKCYANYKEEDFSAHPYDIKGLLLEVNRDDAVDQNTTEEDE